jgi:hypothetical protein
MLIFIEILLLRFMSDLPLCFAFNKAVLSALCAFNKLFSQQNKKRQLSPDLHPLWVTGALFLALCFYTYFPGLCIYFDQCFTLGTLNLRLPL